MANHFGYSKFLACLFILTTLPQCASSGKSVSSEEYTRPIRDMRKAIYYAFKGEVKKTSTNGRTFYSHWHTPGKNLKMPSYKKPERASLIVTLYGDRRPYWIKVLYRVEKLDGSKFKLDRYDKSLAKHYLALIEEYLASRPEERDVIDDFRPY